MCIRQIVICITCWGAINPPSLNVSFDSFSYWKERERGKTMTTVLNAILKPIFCCSQLLLLSSPENTHLLRKGKYHCTADLLFDQLGFGQTSKSVYSFNSKKQLNPNQSNRRSTIQRYLPLQSKWVFSVFTFNWTRLRVVVEVVVVVLLHILFSCSRRRCQNHISE